MKASETIAVLIGVIGVSLVVLFTLSRTQFGYDLFFKIKPGKTSPQIWDEKTGAP